MASLYATKASKLRVSAHLREVNIEKNLKFRLYTVFLKSETSLEFNQLHVFEPYIFFDFVKQLCVVFWMISPSNSQNSSLLVVS